ncbi:hypothetical protein ACFLR8_00885, partial [Bacteroidota bacterium]
MDDDQAHNKSFSTDCALFEDSIILVAGFVSAASCSFHNLRAYDLIGNTVWQKSGYFDVLYTDSNSIFAAGEVQVDDVVGFEQVIISKYDRLGNAIFSSGYPEIPHDGEFYFTPNGIDIYEDGNIIISSSDGIIRADSSGSFISEHHLNTMNDLTGVQFISQVTYLINSQYKLYKSDSSCTLLDSIGFDNQVAKSVLTNDTIFNLLSTGLIRLDTNLLIIDTLFSSNEIIFKDLAMSGKNIWLKGLQSENIKIVHLHNNAIT